MVVTTTYADRIRLSLGLDENSEGKFVRARINDLAQALGVSYTAVAKMLGRDKQFSAINSAKAAKFLGVDHFWLATGEGDKHNMDHWPFPDIDRARFNALSLRQQIEIQGVVRERIERFESPNGQQKVA